MGTAIGRVVPFHASENADDDDNAYRLQHPRIVVPPHVIPFSATILLFCGQHNFSRCGRRSTMRVHICTSVASRRESFSSCCLSQVYLDDHRRTSEFMVEWVAGVNADSMPLMEVRRCWELLIQWLHAAQDPSRVLYCTWR